MEIYEKFSELIPDIPTLKAVYFIDEVEGQKNFNDFLKLDFPSTKLEAWKNTDLKKILERDYSFYLSPRRKILTLIKFSNVKFRHLIHTLFPCTTDGMFTGINPCLPFLMEP